MQLSFVEVKIVATKGQKSERPYDTKNDKKNYVAASLQLLRMTQAPCVHVLMDGEKKRISSFSIQDGSHGKNLLLAPN